MYLTAPVRVLARGSSFQGKKDPTKTYFKVPVLLDGTEAVTLFAAGGDPFEHLNGEVEKIAAGQMVDCDAVWRGYVKDGDLRWSFDGFRSLGRDSK